MLVILMESREILGVNTLLKKKKISCHNKK